MFETSLSKGNKALRNNQYNDAISFYNKALEENPNLKKYIDFNIKLAKKYVSDTDFEKNSPDVITGYSEIDNSVYVKFGEEVEIVTPFFDIEFYRNNNQDVSCIGVDLIYHFCSKGWREGRDPSKEFSVSYYLEKYKDVAQFKDLNPLVHYLNAGKREGRFPSFEEEAISTIKPYVDIIFYIETYPDINGYDPVEHYFFRGWLEGKDPSKTFSTNQYLKNYPHLLKDKINPLYHATKNKGIGKITERPDVIADFYEDSIVHCDSVDVDIKPIAFYLPQFHKIKENDEWWGDGFTDWTSCKRAKPIYEGHWQSRKPHPDIGYYDLLDVDSLRKQASIARRHGIYGFCFYYYNFSGKKILEKPIDLFLENKDIDINFCLCWANENWSRRWDGSDEEVLLAQKYNKEDDINVIKDLSRYIKDERYIRYEGKPVVLVYRKSHLKNPKDLTDKWRKWCRDNNIGEIFLISVQTYQDYTNPLTYGFDAASEMPAHLANPKFNCLVSPNSLPNDFLGTINCYETYAKGIISLRKEIAPDYKLFRTVSLKFDNTGRKPHSPHIFTHFSQDAFYEWVCDSIDHARKELPLNSRFVFINAWNEWAEGTYIEPDMRYGYAHLNTITRALKSVPPVYYRKKKKGKLSPGRILLLDKKNDKTDTCQPTIAKIAVHVHAFYEDVFCNILEYLKNIPFEIDLFITTPDLDLNKFESIANKELNNINQISTIHTLNRGRDIGPLLVYVGKKMLDYDIMLHIHTKKSSLDWLEYLLRRILGDKKTVLRIVSELHNEKNVGLIYPQTFPRWAPHEDFGGNDKWIELIASRLNIPVPDKSSLHFPVGSFYWGKPAALRLLFEHDWKMEDFPEEPIPDDDTIAHGIERIICHLAYLEGYSSTITAFTDDPLAYPQEGCGYFNGYISEYWYNNYIDVFEKKIKENNISTVVFDIFDTLVYRPFLYPEDLFIYIEPLIQKTIGRNLNGFSQLRVEADKICRKRLSKNKDVSLDDIYDELSKHFNLNDDENKKIKKLEIETDIKLISAKKTGLKIFNIAKKYGLQIFFASDMYYSGDVVSKILENVGIKTQLCNQKSTNSLNCSIPQLLVSSEIGLRKDTHGMYSFLSDTCKVDPSQTIVVGDNLHSDVIVPDFNGFCTLKVPSYREQLKEDIVKSQLATLSLKNNNISYLGVVSEILYSNVDFRCSSLLRGSPYCLGVVFLGPLLYEFTRRLISLTKLYKVKKLHFLTREGIIIKEVYDLIASRYINSPQSRILYSSRTIANCLKIVSKESLLNILDNNSYFVGTLKPFFQGRYGYSLTQSDWERLHEAGILDKEYNMSNDRKILEKAIKVIGEKIVRTMKKKGDIYREYLDHELFNGSAFVDIGYSGTMQDCINSISKYKHMGFYICSFSDVDNADIKISVLSKFLHDSEKLEKIFFNYSFYYEALMMPSFPSIVGVKKDDGSFYPVYDDQEVTSTQFAFREEVRRGALLFVKSVLNRFDELPSFDFESVLWGFKEFIEHPVLTEDVMSLKKMDIDDKYSGQNIVKFLAMDKNSNSFFKKGCKLINSEVGTTYA